LSKISSMILACLPPTPRRLTLLQFERHARFMDDEPTRLRVGSSLPAGSMAPTTSAWAATVGAGELTR
jgi:hypothetical protein